jgi:hypothetical protein
MVLLPRLRAALELLARYVTGNWEITLRIGSKRLVVLRAAGMAVVGLPFEWPLRAFPV